MKIPFEKWDATGNDFVLVDLARSPLAEDAFTPKLVTAICDREHGVGADGVVLLHKGDGNGQPSRMTIWNSDGSLGSMCGNALRCVALVLGRNLTSGLSFPVQVGGRLVRTTVQEPERSSVLMGPVAPVGKHSMFDSLPRLDQVLGGRGFLLSFGNPHYVVPGATIPENWALLGAEAQGSAHELLGTGGINCGFLQTHPQADGSYLLRVFERGVGVTKSCGSGACAASAVLETRFGIAPPHRLLLPGGMLEIGRDAFHGFELTGPACLEYEGQWSLS